MPRPRLPLILAVIAVSLPVAACGSDSETGEDSAAPFEPRATLTAIGGTARTDKPALAMRVEARPGDANIRSAAVTLPAAFIADQAAFRNICSESELDANRCAGRKRIGVARVVSSLYDEPLTGPVYPVTGSGGLPRLAYVLGGPADLLLRGRIAVEGVRIQAGIEDAPDMPLESFEFEIDGGKPGYLILSRDICRTEPTADAFFTGQGGERFERRIPLIAECNG